MGDCIGKVCFPRIPRQKESVDMKVVANNKKARHDYFIEETYEAGITLTGTEIKSVRQGRVSLKESYARIREGRGDPLWHEYR